MRKDAASRRWLHDGHAASDAENASSIADLAVVVYPRLQPQHSSRDKRDAKSGNSQRHHCSRTLRTIRVPIKHSASLALIRNCFVTFTRATARTRRLCQCKSSIAKPRISKRPLMEFAACRAGEWAANCDVAEIGDIASDSCRDCGVHSWASDHHHVGLFWHGSVGRHAKENTLSHNRNKACK